MGTSYGAPRPRPGATEAMGDGGHCLRSLYINPGLPFYEGHEVPFAKWKWPCPLKDEIPGMVHVRGSWFYLLCHIHKVLLFLFFF